MSSHLYLYGIVEPGDYRNLGPIGIDSALVLVVPEDGLGVAYSLTEQGRVRPSKRYITAHERVLERLLEDCEAVLPFSFGTVAQARNAIEDLLAIARDDFRENLDRVRGCIEVGLKVLWQKEAMRREVEQITGPIALLGHQGTTEAQRHGNAIQVGQIVEVLVDEWRERYTQIIVSALSPFAIDVHENEAFGPSMLWNGAFLVRKERADDFRDALSLLDKRLGDRIEFRHVAPLPPYNFVQLRFTLGAMGTHEGS